MTVAAIGIPTTDASQPREAWDEECSLASHWRDAEAGICAGYGALPVLPAGDAADHCRHHARRGHPEAPPASETYRSPPSHCPGPCPPGSLRLVLGLTAPRVSPTRLRPLPWAGTTPPSPAPPAVSLHTARGWGGMAVRRQRLPSAPRGCPWATSLACAMSSMLARVCTRLSLHNTRCPIVRPPLLRVRQSV